MQFWPRVRAKNETARVRSWTKVEKPQLLGFGGYKAGMTHLIVTDNRAASMTKGEEISMPVTVVECPPMKVAAFRFYKKEGTAMNVKTEVWLKPQKELARTIPLPKKDHTEKLKDIETKLDSFDRMSVLVYTQPKFTGIGKKKPELFELGVGGKTVKEQYEYAKAFAEKDITIKDIFKEGTLVDVHAVTKGKGFQGPVKRFGISLRSHKAEKTKRGPATLGGWVGHAHFMYRVAHAGQMGYHTRIDYNKMIIMIGDDPARVNPKGGFLRYGLVKSPYVLIKGSVPGPVKRFLRMNVAQRPNRKHTKDAPSIQIINIESKQ